jgi:hypothetical protein
VSRSKPIATLPQHSARREHIVPAPLTGGELKQRSTDSPGARTS